MPPSSSAAPVPDSSSQASTNSSLHQLFKRRKSNRAAGGGHSQTHLGVGSGRDQDTSTQPPEYAADRGEEHHVVSPGTNAVPGQDPSSSIPAEPTTTTTTTTDSSAPPPEAEREKDKDKGSLNSTLTPSQTHAHDRRKADQSTSEGAQSSTVATMTEKPPSTTTRLPPDHPRPASSSPSSTKKKGKKNASASVANTGSSRGRRSLLSKIARVLLPCVPSSHHSIQMDEDEVRRDRRAPTPAGGAIKEKESAAAATSTESEGGPREAPTAPAPKPLDTAAEQILSGESQNAGSSSGDETREPLTIDPPPPLPASSSSSSDPSVIVPPTPTKLLPETETEGMTSGAVQPPGSTGEDPSHGRTRTHGGDRESGDESDRTSFTEEEEEGEPNPMEDVEDEEDRLIMQGGAGIPVGPDGVPRPLLPPIAPQHVGRKCLVLDLDETLVHSSFKSISQADYVVPVEIEYHWHNVYVIKRPGVDNFLKKMGEIYEVVVFTASLSKYADPVLDKLDIHRVVAHRLFRESCYNHRGNYVKDLSQLGRPIADTIILDNSPASYIFHPNNAVPVSSWFNDPHDTELTDLCPFLADLASVDDVRGVLDGGL